MRGSIGRLIDRLVDDRDEVDPDEENRSPVWTRLEGGSFQSPRKSVFTRLEGGAAIREITNRVTGNAGLSEPRTFAREAGSGPGPKTPSSRSAKNKRNVFARHRKRREPGSRRQPDARDRLHDPLGSVTPRADVGRGTKLVERSARQRQRETPGRRARAPRRSPTPRGRLARSSPRQRDAARGCGS